MAGFLTLRALPELTDRQAGMLRYILDYFRDKRIYPLSRELAAHLKLEKSKNASVYIRELVKKGYLIKTSAGKRNIELTPAALEKLTLLDGGKNASHPQLSFAD